MRERVSIILRVIALAIILPTLAIYYPPPTEVNAQCSAVDSGTIRVSQGIISARDQTSFSPKLGPPNVYCVQGTRAVLPDWALIKYDELKTLYFDQAKTTVPTPTFTKNKLTGDKTQANITGLSASDQLYWITSASSNRAATDNDLTLDNDITGNTTGVIFVDGDLIIKHDLVHNDVTGGLVFVVQGRILISRSVRRVDAFLVSYGRKLGATPANDINVNPFCSAWDGVSSTNPNCEDGLANPASQVRLTINGSVISLNAVMVPRFVRQKSDGLVPAEIINYQPKYLVILKDIFSRDVKTWKEIQ